MVEKKGPLKREHLIRLRKLLKRNANANGSMPLEEVALMADLPEETGVTIDFEAAEEQGHPFRSNRRTMCIF